MNDFRHYLTAKGYSRSTVADVLKTERYFRRWAEQQQIDPDTASSADIMAFVAFCRTGNIAPKSIAHRILQLKKYFDFLGSREAAGIQQVNPCTDIRIRDVKKKAVFRVLPAEQLEDIFSRYPGAAVCPAAGAKEAIAARDKAMLGLLIFQGLRSTELRMLATEHLRLEEGSVAVPGSRTSAGRTLPLDARQIYGLMEYIRGMRPLLLQRIPMQELTTSLFLTARGMPVPPRVITGLAQSLQQFQVSNLRQLRASVIVNWIGRYNLRKAQYLAGHKHISSTEAYKVGDLSSLCDDIGRFHPL